LTRKRNRRRKRKKLVKMKRKRDAETEGGGETISNTLLSLRNNRGMNDGKDLSEEYLLDLYTRITCEEMKMLKVRTRQRRYRDTASHYLSFFSRMTRLSRCV
jgi:hypothetical protein